MNNNVFDLPRLPPTPLHMEYESFIDRDILSKLVNSLYYNYESCNFGHVSWLYFHALCIPVHMAPMHFGATIEALRKSYIANNKSKIETKLINNFNDLSKCLLVELSGHEIKKTEREILENKIKNLNQVPESLLMKRFLLSLNTKLSPVEMSAWKQRNKAAHGTETDYNEFTKLIRENKVLKTIFHRLILRISGHDYYYDYYSFDHPIRNVSEGIPNESN